MSLRARLRLEKLASVVKANKSQRYNLYFIITNKDNACWELHRLGSNSLDTLEKLWQWSLKLGIAQSSKIVSQHWLEPKTKPEKAINSDCQDRLILPCNRFSVSQNFCNSVKYLSRMKTLEMPRVAELMFMTQTRVRIIEGRHPSEQKHSLLSMKILVSLISFRSKQNLKRIETH